MTERKIQPSHEIPSRSVLSPYGSSIPLPTHFLEAARAWIDAGKELCECPHDFEDNDFQEEIIAALGDIIRVIDDAVDSLDLSDFILPSICCLLGMQGEVLRLRYHLLRDPGDIDRAIHLFKTLPQFCHPTNTNLLANFSSSLDQSLFARLSLDSALPLETQLCRMLRSAEIPPDFIELADSAVEDANKFARIPAAVRNTNDQPQLLKNLDWAIDAVDDISEDRGASDQTPEPLSLLISIQVAALQARFKIAGDITDLERSVSVSETAPQFCNSVSQTPTPFTHSPSPHSIPRDPEELDKVISFGEELLTRAHALSQHTVSLRLAVRLYNRSVDKGCITDGERALQLCEEALPFIEGTERIALVSLQAHTLILLSYLGKRFPNIRQSLVILEEGLGNEDSSSAKGRGSKSNFLWTQLKIAAISGDDETTVCAFEEITPSGYARWKYAYGLFLDNSDTLLLRAIGALRQECLKRSSEDERLKPFAVILSIALSYRYDRYRNLGDLQEALSLRQSLGSPVYMESSIRGSICQLTLGHNLDSKDKNNELERIPERNNAALGRWQDNYDSYQMQTFGDISDLHRAYWEARDKSDFHAAQREYLVQLRTAPKDPHQLWNILQSLSDLCALRYERLNEIHDLEQAVDHLRRAVDGLESDDEGWQACYARTSWGIRVFELHKATSCVDHSHLLRAQECFRRSAATTTCPPVVRLTCLLYWFRNASGLLWKHCESHVPQICDLALSLLEEQSWTAVDPRSSINNRFYWKELGTFALRLVIVVKLVGVDTSKVIEVIEAFQGLVWGQLRRLREPVDDLSIDNPELASRFKRLSSTLERRLGVSKLDDTPEGKVDPLGTNNWQLHYDLNEVIGEIRALPQFAKFSRRGLFDEVELRALAQDGPIVIRSDMVPALIIHRDDQFLLDLPITYPALAKLHKSLQRIANSRDGDEDFTDDLDPVANTLSSVAEYLDTRSGSSRSRKLSTEEVLEALWRGAAEPVLEEIMKREAGDNRTQKVSLIPKPDLAKRQRIWWCCLGEFSFLPIHAAGIYRGESPVCVSDFFVSSYTPTTGAIFEARKRQIPSEVTVLAAAQPNPGARWKRLPKVEEEMKEIIRVVPPQNLIPLANTNKPDYEGQHTTIENVGKHLPEATVLHLACHGTQSTLNPLSSGFILANAEKMTIEELLRYRLPNAHIAILSACHTASNDAEQPDEAINLASAFMFLGFSSILATKWPMNDSDGPLIAKTVYQAMFKPGQSPAQATVKEDMKCDRSTPDLASFSLARVVDDIVRHLRLVKKVPASRWATFVHVGI